MNWYIAKMVFQIVCGDGRHAAQFDEQLRLIQAADGEQAFDKAAAAGRIEEETFYNQKAQPVRWIFINVSQLYRLGELIDGAELYSRIKEVDDASSYITFVNRKAESICGERSHHILNLI